jgi:hypothetical protein
MSDGEFGAFPWAIVFLSPALVILVFAWLVWLDRRPRAVPGWRREAFKWGMFSASVATILISPGCAHLLSTGRLAQGFLLFVTRFAALLWFAGLAASLVGKSWERMLLFSWGIMFFLGIVAMVVITTP